MDTLVELVRTVPHIPPLNYGPAATLFVALVKMVGLALVDAYLTYLSQLA